MDTHSVFLMMGVLCIGALVSSAIGIWRHLSVAGVREDARKYTVRILLMVPIYSIQAFYALLKRLILGNQVLELLRKGYECVCIFAFLQLLVCHLRGFDAITSKLPPGRCHHIWPVKLLLKTPYEAHDFVKWTLKGVLQYVWVALFGATVGFLLFPFKPVFEVVIPCFNVVVGASQLVAMYCLVVFYHANQQRLAKLHPILKLLCIKMLVMFTVWQSFILHFAKRLHFFERFADRSKKQWGEEQICDFVINCLLIIEMFVLSVVHHYVYPVHENRSIFRPRYKWFEIEYSDSWKEVLVSKFRLYQLKQQDAGIIFATDKEGNHIDISWLDEKPQIEQILRQDQFPLKINALDRDDDNQMAKKFRVEHSEDWETEMRMHVINLFRLNKTNKIHVTSLCGKRYKVIWSPQLDPAPHQDQFPLKFHQSATSTEATYTFEPESVKLLGIVCNPDGYVLNVVDDSQARDKDINTGDRIVKVEPEKWKKDDERWHDALARARDANAAYSLTFEVQRDWRGTYRNNENDEIEILQSASKIQVVSKGRIERGTVRDCTIIIPQGNNLQKTGKLQNGVIAWSDKTEWILQVDWSGIYDRDEKRGKVEIKQHGKFVEIIDTSQASTQRATVKGRIITYKNDEGFLQGSVISWPNARTWTLRPPDLVKGQHVKCRNSDNVGWIRGVVTSAKPLEIKPYGWPESLPWKQARKLSFRIEQKVAYLSYVPEGVFRMCRSSGVESWQWGSVTSIFPSIKLDRSLKWFSELCDYNSWKLHTLASWNLEYSQDWVKKMQERFSELNIEEFDGIAAMDNTGQRLAVAWMPQLKPHPEREAFPLDFDSSEGGPIEHHPEGAIEHDPEGRRRIFLRFVRVLSLRDIVAFWHDFRDLQVVRTANEIPLL